MDLQDRWLYPLAFGALLVMAFPGPGRRRLRAAERRYALTAGEHSSGLLRDYLRRTRRGRSAGVLLAAVVLAFALYAWPFVEVLADTVAGPFTPFALAVLLLGYLAGSALSEISWSMPAPGHRRAAGLQARSLSTYLPTWVPALQRGLAGLAVVLLAALTLLVDSGQASRFDLVRSAAWGAFLAAGVIAVAVVAEAGQRRVLARPQSWTDVETVRLDDTIRAWSQRNLAAAAFGIQLLLLGQLAIQVLLRLADVGNHPGVAHRLDALGIAGHVLVPLTVIALLWQRLSLLPVTPGQGAAAGGPTR